MAIGEYAIGTGAAWQIGQPDAFRSPPLRRTSVFRPAANIAITAMRRFRFGAKRVA